MGEPKVEAVVVLRPKTLRGEARAVHAAEIAPANGSAPIDPAAGSAAVQGGGCRLRSQDRRVDRARAMAALRVCLDVACLDNGDFGAVIGEPKETARRILAGLMPFTIEHQMRLHDRMPKLHEMYFRELFR